MGEAPSASSTPLTTPPNRHRRPSAGGPVRRHGVRTCRPAPRWPAATASRVRSRAPGMGRRVGGPLPSAHRRMTPRARRERSHAPTRPRNGAGTPDSGYWRDRDRPAGNSPLPCPTMRPARTRPPFRLIRTARRQAGPREQLRQTAHRRPANRCDPCPWTGPAPDSNAATTRRRRSGSAATAPPTEGEAADA